MKNDNPRIWDEFQYPKGSELFFGESAKAKDCLKTPSVQRHCVQNQLCHVNGVHLIFLTENISYRISSSKAPKIQDAHESKKNVLSEPCRVKRIACEKHARTSTSGQKCTHQTWLKYILWLTPTVAYILTHILDFILHIFCDIVSDTLSGSVPHNDFDILSGVLSRI